MPDGKFKSGSFSSIGGMTSQNFPLKKGTSQFQQFHFQFQFQQFKCQFQQFPSRGKLFEFQNFLDVSMRKSSSNQPLD